MKRFITVISLGVCLAVSSGVASAQEKDAPIILGNVDGTCVTSPSAGNPGANAGDWTITCGDITPGSGMTVIGAPPSAETVSAAGESGPAPAPAPVADPAPVAEPAPETTVDAAETDTAVASETDLDADNYPDALEWDLGLDPNNADTDADGVADGDELNIYGTNPTGADSDGDGVFDGEELFGIQTDPLVWNDTSADTGTQSLEQETTSDPVQTLEQQDEALARGQDTSETVTATNGDAAVLGSGNASAAPGNVTRGGISGTSLLGPDGTYSVTEISPPNVSVSGDTGVLAPAPEPAPEAVAVTEETAEPVVADTAVATETDLDGDNYPDALEWELGLDPGNADTDADGVADGDELNIYSTEPTVFDTDGDGLSDGEELFASATDPGIWDTDGDGVRDGEVVNADSTVPLDPASGS